MHVFDIARRQNAQYWTICVVKIKPFS